MITLTLVLLEVEKVIRDLFGLEGVVGGASQDQTLSRMVCWTPQKLDRWALLQGIGLRRRYAISSLGSYSRKDSPYVLLVTIFA